MRRLVLMALIAAIAGLLWMIAQEDAAVPPALERARGPLPADEVGPRRPPRERARPEESADAPDVEAAAPVVAVAAPPPRPPGVTRVGNLSARVVGADGKPLANAYVEIQGDGWVPRFGRTDADGRVEFRDVPDGALALRTGGTAWMVRRPCAVDFAIPVDPSVARINEELESEWAGRGGTIDCRVEASGERPDRSLHWDVCLVGATPGEAAARTVPMSHFVAGAAPGANALEKLAREGKPVPNMWRSYWLPPGSRWTLVARLRDHLATEAWAIVRDVAAPTSGLVVTAVPSRTVRGRLEPKPDFGTKVRIRAYPESVGQTVGIETWSALDGTFEIRAPHESIVVTAGADGDRVMSADAVTVGANDQDVVVRLMSTPALSGRLLFSDGEPVAFGRVRAAPAEVRIDAEGRFRFPCLVPGVRKLTFLWLADVAIALEPVRVPYAGEVDVVLPLAAAPR